MTTRNRIGVTVEWGYNPLSDSSQQTSCCGGYRVGTTCGRYFAERLWALDGDCYGSDHIGFAETLGDARALCLDDAIYRTAGL